MLEGFAKGPGVRGLGGKDGWIGSEESIPVDRDARLFDLLFFARIDDFSLVFV